MTSTGTAITAGSRPHPRARFTLVALAICGLAALACASFVQPSVRLVYNASDSVPVGWYRVTPAQSLSAALRVDDIVLTTLPAEAVAFAAQRGYLPSHVPLLKRVGAIAPQHVCLVAGIVRIDGESEAAVRRVDSRGRPLPSWPQCRSLAEGELFLFNAMNSASFDSRYFGPVRVDAVIGVAHSIWLESQP